MPTTTPLPVGFRLRPDARTQHHHDGHLLLGGSPRRALRLSDAGARVAARLLAGEPVRTDAEGALARRLVDTGMAHPVPAPTAVHLEVVIPVYNDSKSLRACLRALGDTVAVTVVDDGSVDASSVAEVAASHGAGLVRLTANRGPAAARNAGVSKGGADVIAFVDADALADVDALKALAAHLGDPLVAAAAPRVCPDTDAVGVLRAFARASSPLDLGTRAASVTWAGHVAYVPSTVLVVRRSALLDVAGFDESLRYGEDVDLVWRLLEAGYRVRYEPAVQVRHREPASWPRWLRRRFCYGTSAGALAQRHGERAAPLLVAPAPATTVALAVAGLPGPAGAVAAGAAWRLRRRLRAADVPAGDATRAALMAPAVTAMAAARWATQLWWPVLLAAATRSRRARAAVAVALVTPPLVEWAVRRPDVDPVRWTLAVWADDAAYGFGVWRGAVAAATTRPLRPRFPRRDTTRTSA